jgi:cytidine deaminase
LLTARGEVFSAPEMADGDAGVGTCAERAALYRAVAEGHRRFRTLLIRSGQNGRGRGGPPCGACLQVLCEFSPGLRVFWGSPAHPEGGWTVRELLPGAFNSGHIVPPVARDSHGRKRREDP